jgi:hypothetical protein
MDNIVLIILAIFSVLIITYYIVFGYLEGKISLVYNTDMNLDNSSIEVSNSDELSYGMWFNINKLREHKLNESNIMLFDRPNELKFYIENSALKINRGTNDYEIMSNFPLQKWVHLIVTVENIKTEKSFVNAYIDGKMVRSYQIPYLKGAETEVNLGNLDAKLVGLKRWKYPLNPAMVLNEYNSTKLTGLYNLDITLMKNQELAKRFNVF